MVQLFQEIQERSQTLLQAANFYKSVEGKSVLSQISELWCSGKYRNILLTGMGSSYSIANATAPLLNSYKISAYILNTGGLLHYQVSLISPESLIICISQSGESYEVIKLIEKLSSSITIPSICNGKDSNLIEFSRYNLLCKAGKEEKTSTKTLTTCYQIAYLLAMKLYDQEIDNTQWHKPGKIIENMVNGNIPWISEVIELTDGSTSVQLIGRGPVFAAASQSALMFMEAAHTPTSVLSGDEFGHGPLEMVKKGFIAILFIHLQSKTYEQSLSLVRDILKYEGEVIFITGSNLVFENDNLCTTTIPDTNAELFTTPCIVPIQLLTNTWATKCGIIPGEFAHGARITSIE